MKKNILSLAAMEKLLKNAGSIRVSESAKEALQGYLEEKALEVGRKAATFSLHSGRRTVKAEDIKLALR